MQKNWYIIYTKEGNEKKVASILTKKKIENLLMLTSKSVRYFRKIKLNYEPLFPSYVFVKTEESNLSKIKAFDSVISFVYWKGKPAVVREDEINAIKDFMNDYSDIKLEKTFINPNGTITMERPQFYALEGNLLTIKSKTVKVNLPSIGFTLIASLSSENRLSTETSFKNEKLLLQ
jgi:transcription antitermination factor NusG